MRKKIILSVLIFGIFCIMGCLGDVDDDDMTLDFSESSYQPNKVLLRSSDQLDGTIHDDYGLNSVRFDEQVQDTATHWTHTRGFFTFELPPDVGMAQSAVLRIYVTDYLDSCSDSPANDHHLYLFVKPWSVQEKDYAKWQECTYYWYGPSGPSYDPDGCEIVPHQEFHTPEFEMKHDDTAANKGWYKLDSARFLDFIKDLQYTQYSEKIYFSFEMDIEVRGEFDNCGYYPVFDVYFEDGGNHGGTGNLPTLEITYE